MRFFVLYSLMLFAVVACSTANPSLPSAESNSDESDRAGPIVTPPPCPGSPAKCQALCNQQGFPYGICNGAQCICLKSYCPDYPKYCVKFCISKGFTTGKCDGFQCICG